MTTIAEYINDSRIPKRALRYLNRKAVIQDPLRPEDLANLQFLEKIWGDREVLRAQLKRLSLKARTSLIRTANLDTKWERYAYSRFRNQSEESILSMKRVVYEIETTFGFKLNKQHIRRLSRVRNRAQVARHRDAKSLESAEGNSFLQSTTKEKETAFIALLPDEKNQKEKF